MDRVETLETWSKVIFVLILVLMALAITVITLREREASRAVSTQRLGRIWRLAASAAAERQAAAAYKAAASRHLSRIWRLTARARVWEGAYEAARAEKTEANMRHLERTEAMECGETFYFQAESPQDPLSQLADASYDTMSRRMDLGEAPAWMRWNNNHAWFAARAWGAVTWRWLVETLSASVLEIISLGSCGAGVGKGLLQKMFATIAEQSRGKIFIVLKSMAGAETFWSQQGFSTLPKGSSQPQSVGGCPPGVAQTLQQYSAETLLTPFYLTLDSKKPRTASTSSSTSYGSTSTASTSSMV